MPDSISTQENRLFVCVCVSYFLVKLLSVLWIVRKNIKAIAIWIYSLLLCETIKAQLLGHASFTGSIYATLWNGEKRVISINVSFDWINNSHFFLCWLSKPHLLQRSPFHRPAVVLASPYKKVITFPPDLECVSALKQTSVWQLYLFFEFFSGLKEGYLDYKGYNVLGLTTRWIQGYFVLT